MKTAVSAFAFLMALSVSAPAQEGVSTEKLLEIARTAYPGEFCFWERAEDAVGSVNSWTLTFRYESEKENGPDRKVNLYEIPCFMGAYNYGTVWFIEREYEGVTPLHFATPFFDIDYTDQEETAVNDIRIVGWDTQAALVNPEFDESNQTITSFSKSRGLGDAFTSGVWTFHEGKFILTHYEIDPTFNGEIDPVTVFGEDN